MSSSDTGYLVISMKVAIINFLYASYSMSYALQLQSKHHFSFFTAIPDSYLAVKCEKRYKLREFCTRVVLNCGFVMVNFIHILQGDFIGTGAIIISLGPEELR